MHFNMIVAYEQMKDWESAKAKLKEYLAEYPDDEAAKKGIGISGDKIIYGKYD